MKFKNSFKLFSIVLLFITISGCETAKKSNDLNFDALPSNLVLREDQPQGYTIDVNYTTRDLYGNTLNRMKLTADYIRALNDGKVRWNNVYISKALSPDEAFNEPVLQEYMEDFSYKPSGDMLKDEFFRDFPPEIMETKVLIWDMMSIEVWAWNYFDKLELNTAFQTAPDGEDFQMTDAVSFQNKDLKLTWTGISKINNELAAVIQYESLFNPLEMNTVGFSLKGRTNYWGTIWVSLEDKQIEYAVLKEDGLLEMKFSGQDQKTLVNAFREIYFQKQISE